MMECLDGRWKAMDLTLKYSGELRSAGSASRVRHKHDIREYFHHQLAVHWSRHSVLGQYNPSTFQRPRRDGRWFNVDRPVNEERGGLFWRHHVKRYNVVPLVNQIHMCNCHLAIRMHCPRDEGSILLKGGDIDNRLKVILDALSMPQDESQIPSREEDEPPESSSILFCLLEGDELVTKLSVTRIPLLDDRGGSNHVEIDIDVHIDPVYPMNANLRMLFP